MNAIKTMLKKVEATDDLLERSLMLAGLVSSVFRKAGWNLVVVGGAAVEFYTEGAYMSGDIDLCRENLKPIPLRLAQDLMAELGAEGGPRSWLVAGLYVDLLGVFENESVVPCRDVDTPCGSVRLMPAELAIVERVLLAYYPDKDSDAREVAKKMISVCISGATKVDWQEVERLAALPDFRVTDELHALINEVRDEI